MTDPDDLDIAYHVVCVIDVLGQRQKLERWADLPADGCLTPEITKAMHQTVDVVRKFKRRFEYYFKLVEQCTVPDQVAALSEEQRALYDRVRDCSLAVQQFSDTFVFYSRVLNEYGDVSIVPLYRILGACGYGMIFSLAEGSPVRGSICVGPGTELEKHNFYGPALAEAHKLESELARYPRVVVSEAAAGFARWPRGYSHNKSVGVKMQQIAGTCRQLMYQDTDDQHMVDFMGEGMRGLLVQTATVTKLLEKAYEFVCSEGARFAGAGNSKHAERYHRLRKYMESRLALWDLKPIGNSK